MLYSLCFTDMKQTTILRTNFFKISDLYQHRWTGSMVEYSPKGFQRFELFQRKGLYKYLLLLLLLLLYYCYILSRHVHGQIVT